MSTQNAKISTALVEISNVSATTPEGRPLFIDLNMRLSNEHVALIGRNGVGKSTFLEILAGVRDPDCGEVASRITPYLVPQQVSGRDVIALLDWVENTSSIDPYRLAADFAAAGLPPIERILREEALSHGEIRKLKLLIAKYNHPDLLLLDEPTEDLDERGVAWLRSWLSHWQGGLIVASHAPQLLRDFHEFFLITETGCRSFSGDFDALTHRLDEEHLANETRYLRNLNRLVEEEEHTLHIARRRRRKKQFGRVRELGRATPRQRLNQKRDYAQVKHGRMKRLREARLGAAREWTRNTRRALKVDLPLQLSVPELSPTDSRELITLTGVSAVVGSRCLFSDINLHQHRERIAVTGANGAGKTTLLEIMLGWRAPSSGTVKTEAAQIGAIAQGGTDWMLDESLFSYLNLYAQARSPEALTKLIIAHKFPLALAKRPLRSLSPGERVRAALICLFQRAPSVELLILDEPTYSLDLLGRRALIKALQTWPGGLVVASHDREFLEQIGIKRSVRLGE